MSRVKRPPLALHKSAEFHTSDSGPSGSSRHSVSEASKAIDSRRKGEPSYRPVVGYGKEGRGHLPPTLRQDDASGSTTPVSVHPTQRTSSKYGITASYLTPGPSSNKQPPGRITFLPRQSTDISLYGAGRFISDTSDPPPPYLSKSTTTKSTTAASRPYIPKQQITSHFAAPATRKGAKIDKVLAPVVPPNPPTPPTQLAEAEEGEWEGDLWVEKERVAVVGIGDEAEQGQAALKTKGNSDVTSMTKDAIASITAPLPPTTSPIADLPSSPPPPPPPRTGPRWQTRSPPTSPTSTRYAHTSDPPILPKRKEEPLFMPVLEEDELDDDEVGFTSYQMPREETPVPDPIDRSQTRRQRNRVLSPDTEDEGEHAAQEESEEEPEEEAAGGVASNPTQVARTSTRQRRASTTSLSYSQHIDPALRPSKPEPVPTQQPRRASEITSKTPALKRPQTYGASKTTPKVPPPLGERTRAEKRKRQESREQRRAAKLAEQDHLQQLGGAVRVRIGGYRTYDNHAPISDIRGSSYPRGGTKDGLSGVLARSRSASVRQPEASDPWPDANIRRAGDDARPPREENMYAEFEANLDRINANDSLYPPNANESESEDDAEATFAEWSRGPYKKAKKPKRRDAPVSYAYLKGGRPPTSGNTDYRYRARDKSGRKQRYDEEDDTDGECKRRKWKHRRREHDAAWPRFSEADQTEEEVDPRCQPLSKYGDPVEKDKAYQLEKHGLYVVGEGMATKTGRKWDKGSRSTRERRALAPKLKMSRKRSANERVDKYVQVISEHSKSSRRTRPLPRRSYTSKAVDLPAYVIKPLKTVSWEEYNEAYREERPFPINHQLVQRTMSDARAKALRPAGRNRLRMTRTGVRQDREIRRMESRLEGIDDMEERIDTLTPSLRPPIEARPAVGRLPKLVFTTRSPTPPPALPARSQRKKVTKLLMTTDKEGDDDDVVLEEDWGVVRPDPIIPDFFDDASQPIPAARPAAAPQPADVPTKVAGKTTYRSTTTGQLQSIRNPPTPASADEDLAAFLQERLGEDEMREIEAHFPLPDVEVEVRRTTGGKTALAPRPIQANVIDNADFPSVPSAVDRASASTAKRQPVAVASETSSGSNMMSGVGMADHMMEALKSTMALFNQPPAKVPPPPTGGVVGKAMARPRRPRQQKDGGKTEVKGKKAKGKGRDPGERPQERLRLDSQLTLPTMLEHRPRATQLPSRTDLEEEVAPPSSGKVTVEPPVSVATSPLAGMMGSGPRLGLQRTRTAGLATPLRTPLLGGKSMNMLKSQFKPPTQITPTQLSRPRPPPAAITSRHVPSSDIDDPYDAESAYYQPGQHLPSPTQTTTVYGNRTQGGRSRASTTKVSTTQRNSSSANLMSDQSGDQGYDDSAPILPRSYAQKAASLYNYQHYSTGNAPSTPAGGRQPGLSRTNYGGQAPAQYQYPPQPRPRDDLPRAQPVIPASRQLGPSSSSSGGFVPVNPSTLIRRTSFSKVMPKASALKRSMRTDYLGSEVDQAGGSARGSRQTGREERGRDEEGAGGVKMSRIGSQRARKQFRAPTMTHRGEEGEDVGRRR